MVSCRCFFKRDPLFHMSKLLSLARCHFHVLVLLSGNIEIVGGIAIDVLLVVGFSFLEELIYFFLHIYSNSIF